MWPSGAGRLSAGCGSPSQTAEAFPEPSPRPCTAGPGQGTRLGHNGARLLPRRPCAHALPALGRPGLHCAVPCGRVPSPAPVPGLKLLRSSGTHLPFVSLIYRPPLAPEPCGELGTWRGQALTYPGRTAGQAQAVQRSPAQSRRYHPGASSCPAGQGRGCASAYLPGTVRRSSASCLGRRGCLVAR